MLQNNNGEEGEAQQVEVIDEAGLTMRLWLVKQGDGFTVLFCLLLFVLFCLLLFVFEKRTKLNNLPSKKAKNDGKTS